MATANQNSSAPNVQKAPLFQRYGALSKESPQSVTPQNFKSSQIQTTKADILLDTAKNSTKSQGNGTRQIMTLQNSQIQGRKIDSPKIYVNEQDGVDLRPKTSAQCSRRTKTKRSKQQIATPANLDKKIKTFKNTKSNGQGAIQTTSGSQLHIPHHPVSSRRPQRFDFGFGQDKEDLEAGALPTTEREALKRKLNSNAAEKDTCNNSTAQLSAQNNNTGLSKYQQSRMQGGVRAKSSNTKSTRQRHISQSMQLGVTMQKPLDKQQLQTPNQQQSNANALSQSTVVKTLRSQRQPKFQNNYVGPKAEEKSRDRQTRSSDQKSKPTLKAASKKGMSIRKSKFQQSQLVGTFTQNQTSKSSGANNLRYRLNKKSHSIESQSKLHQATEGRDGQFSLDLDNKENYPSNSSLHHKSKPLSEQSKSVSAGRSRTGRNQKLKNDMSLSDLSQNSQKLEVKASGGSLSKMLGKQFFIDGEKFLQCKSPGAPTRSENPRKRNELDAKMLSYSRASSPPKQPHRNKQKSKDGVKCSIDSKSGDDIRRVKNVNTQMTSLGDFTSSGKSKPKANSTEKQVKQKMYAKELLRQFMEETQRKTDREIQRAKDSDQQRMQEQLNAKSKKKKRSKSCISKIGEGVFSARDQIRDRSKESANKTCLLSDALSGSIKRTGARESGLQQLNSLKREINEEIRKERGNHDIPRTVVTPSAAKPLNYGLNKSGPRKPSTGGGTYTSLRVSDVNKNMIQSQVHCDKLVAEKRGSDINHNKIRKYIERQKKQAQIKKCMRETIEHEKHIKVKETLMELQKFTQKGKKRTSKHVTTSLRVTTNSLNIKNVMKSEPGLNSTQQIQLLDHVRNHLPPKHLKPQSKPLKNKKRSVQAEVQLEDDYEEEESHLERTFQGIVDEESAIINLISQEISSSKTNSLRHYGRDMSPTESEIEYPLKELKPKLGTGSQRPGKKNNLKVDPLINLTQAPVSGQTFSHQSDNFESLEPSRYPSDNNTNKHRSTPKQPASIYDKSETNPLRRNNENFDHAAIQIQKLARGFLQRKYVKKLLSKKSSPYQNTTDQNNTAGSIRKMNIPSLNLQKINSAEAQANPYGSQKPEKGGLSRSDRSTNIFDHNTFQHSNKPLLPQDEMSDLPELIKIREAAIREQEQQEQRQLQHQLDHNKVSPRTFQRKQRDLEVWVTKETNKVAKARESYESSKLKDRQDQYLKNVHQDSEQIIKILGSARSSTKSKQHLNQGGLMVSSARDGGKDGINSFRVDSTRKSHRVMENQLIDLIYEKQTKPQNESSSQSRGGKQEIKVQDGHQSASQRSHSNNYDSSYSPKSDSDEYGNLSKEDVEIPNFNNVNVPSKPAPTLKLEATEQLNRGASENSLNRNLSQKRLNNHDTQPLLPDKTQSPRLLVKTGARAKLHEEIDEEEAELSRQVMEVSPPPSEGSRTNIKDELKESLKSDNFFLNKMDSTASNNPETANKSGNIRIETGEETQPTGQQTNSALIGTISPLSGASSDFGIQRGGMSLESSTSGENKLGENKLANIISEIQQEDLAQQQKIDEIRRETTLTPDQADFAEALTQEILQLLVAETMEFEMLVNREAAQQLRNQQQQQEQMQQMQQLSGIKTDLFAIERYVDEIVIEINTNSAEFLKTLNTPISKDNIVQLNQLQNSEVGSCEHFDENFPQVLPLDLYLTLEKRRKETRERNNVENPQAPAGSQVEMLRILIAECEHIHNKVLFDCINDSLLQFKPYGKEGEPLPWTRKNRRLKPTDDFSVQEIFEIVKHDLFRWAITQSGTLPKREFVYRGVFDEELFAEIREKKLVALLQREMIETEPRWLNYEFEQAQAKIDVGDMILEMLVTETVNMLIQNMVEADLKDHPLMQEQPVEAVVKQESVDVQQQRDLEDYEAHILNDIGVGGSFGVRRQSDSSPDRSGYNSKDSDFSNNFEGSEVGDDFGGNQSRESMHDDEF